MTITRLNYDPFYVGIDRILDRMHDINKGQNTQTKYPPYNIIKVGENSYLIEMALAGFDENDFDIELHNGVLKVSADVSAVDEDADYIYKGIAARSFERTFTLADTVKVDTVKLSQGMLTIRLVNDIPEERKPQKIAINSKSDGDGDKQYLTE